MPGGCMATGADSGTGCLAEPQAAVLAQLTHAVSAIHRGFKTHNDAQAGFLAQVWVPQTNEQGVVRLETKDFPFAIIGRADLLALFRCLSCKYSFLADAAQPSLLGVPGRVFLSKHPEAVEDTAQVHERLFHRAEDAQLCKVSSALFVPIFASRDHGQPVAVFEISQQCATHVSALHCFAQAVLKEVGLYAPDTEPTHASSLISLQSQPLLSLQASGSDGATATDASAGQSERARKRRRTVALAGMADESDALHASRVERALQEVAVLLGAIPKREASEIGSQAPAGDSDDGSVLAQTPEETPETPRGAAEAEEHFGAKHLSLKDVQAVFGNNLKDAAARLGVCATTLKRACRKHGIKKWPRRHLVKLSKALDGVSGSGLDKCFNKDARYRTGGGATGPAKSLGREKDSGGRACGRGISGGRGSGGGGAKEPMRMLSEAMQLERQITNDVAGDMRAPPPAKARPDKREPGTGGQAAGPAVARPLDGNTLVDGGGGSDLPGSGHYYAAEAMVQDGGQAGGVDGSPCVLFSNAARQQGREPFWPPDVPHVSITLTQQPADDRFGSPLVGGGFDGGCSFAAGLSSPGPSLLGPSLQQLGQALPCWQQHGAVSTHLDGLPGMSHPLQLSQPQVGFGGSCDFSVGLPSLDFPPSCPYTADMLLQPGHF